MPLMEIIKRANKITNPPELTETTGTEVIMEFDYATQSYKEKTISKWRHTEAYYKLRGSHTVRKVTPATEGVQPQSMSRPDTTTPILRQSKIDLNRFSAEERAVIMKLLEDSK